MKDRPQTVYSCDTLQPALQKRTVVLSTYGHHNSDKTVVDIMAASSWNNQSITLILANYFPTKWRMNLHEGVRIEKIILVSERVIFVINPKQGFIILRLPLQERKYSFTSKKRRQIYKDMITLY